MLRVVVKPYNVPVICGKIVFKKAVDDFRYRICVDILPYT